MDRKILEERASKLRINATPSELIFMGRLIAKNTKFEFQCIIEPYIVDFLIGNTIVELDGSSHIGREDYDKRRDIYLMKKGYHVIRIPNEEAFSCKLPKYKQEHKSSKNKRDKKKITRQKQLQKERFEKENSLYTIIQNQNGDFVKVKNNKP